MPTNAAAISPAVARIGGYPSTWGVTVMSTALSRPFARA